MFYHQDLKGCSTPQQSDFKEILTAARKGVEAIKAEFAEGKLPVLDCLEAASDLAALQSFAKKWQGTFEDIVILGTGGSSLGGQTLCALNGWGNTISQRKPRLHFFDNVDPLTFNQFFQNINLQDVGVIAISKSGSTIEVLTQVMCFLRQFRQQGIAHFSEHFCIITEPKDSPLNRFAQTHAIATFAHHTGIGGRFAGLTNVGLLPALLMGLDAAPLLAAAHKVADEFLQQTSVDNAPLLGAATLYYYREKHKCTATVLMPYLDQLRSFSYWFRQLWAESLGKEGKGLTPLNALGTVDQHSQLQLYLDGPKDKTYTIITLDAVSCNANFGEEDLVDSSLDYLVGKGMYHVLQAEQEATIQTLIENQCPTRVLRLQKLDAEVLGALMMHFIIETMVMAKLLNINAFDQPAVEAGKVLTHTLLRR